MLIRTWEGTLLALPIAGCEGHPGGTESQERPEATRGFATQRSERRSSTPKTRHPKVSDVVVPRSLRMCFCVFWRIELGDVRYVPELGQSAG